jgi:predicted DNA-binding transcriptional regulator AlpA
MMMARLTRHLPARWAGPAFLVALEAVRVEAILEAARQVTESGAERRRDRVLTVKQTAERLGRSSSWVYKNRSTLPVVLFSTGGYGFSERRLEEWIRRRT